MLNESIGRRRFCRGLLAGGCGAYWGVACGAGDSHARVTPRQFDDMITVSPESVGVDETRLEEVLQFVGQGLDAGPCPGAALAATLYGKIFVERYWGTYACAERNGLPCNGEVQHPLYSFSKSIAATIAAMVQQEGRIDYDDSVAKYIPGFSANGKDVVTLRHLLTHSAGLPSIPLEYVGDEENWQRVIAKLCTASLEWEPGSKTLYHPISGMLLMADVVRRVSDNKPWNDICSERLFVPLETDGFTFTPAISSSTVAIVPPPDTYPYPIDKKHFAFLGHPAGGTYGRPRDILKLLNLNLNGGVWKQKTLLKPDALAETHRIQYQKQIDQAIKEGRHAAHEYWGLGWLHRGGAKESWFGFGSETSPQTFGHAGIDTVMGIADPECGIALVFITTAPPGDTSATMKLRNGVTDRIMAALVA